MNALPPELLVFGLLVETALEAAIRLLFTGAQCFLTAGAAVAVLLLAGKALRYGLAKEPAAPLPAPPASAGRLVVIDRDELIRPLRSDARLPGRQYPGAAGRW